jgi:hypothetical protein
MSKYADVKLDAGGRGNPKEAAAQTLEERRVYGTLAMGVFRVEGALFATYPEEVLPVQLEVDGEAPANAAAAARTSSAAAHQAIQSAIAHQTPEFN